MAEAKIGVIVSSARAYAANWDSRRILAGLPWTAKSLPAFLESKGVSVALGIVEEWQARNTRVEAAWQYINGGGEFSKATALGLVSSRLDKLLGVEPVSKVQGSWVAWEGDWTELNSKVVAVRSQGQSVVDLFA